MFDLVLRGGLVIDCTARTRRRADVGVRNGLIEAVSGSIAERGVVDVDATGLTIGPGWVDTHTHVFNLVKPSCLDADRIGVDQGVVALLDAGSFGALNAEAFQEYVVRPSKTLAYGLIHISRFGNMHAPGESEIASWLNVDDAVLAIEQNRQWIKGMKVRASTSAVGSLGMMPVVLAKKAASEAGVPLMAHVGNAPPTLDEVCRTFTAGDVITHCFHGKVGGAMMRDGRALPALVDAVERGVRLDVGHGSGSFSFDVAERALAAGLRPYHISTDLHRGNVSGPVFSLALTMSKLLHLGMDLYDVVAAASINPASTFGLDEIGPVEAGRTANLTLFRVSERDLVVHDSYRGERTISRVIEPRLVVSHGDAYPVMGATPGEQP